MEPVPFFGTFEWLAAVTIIQGDCKQSRLNYAQIHQIAKWIRQLMMNLNYEDYAVLDAPS